MRFNMIFLIIWDNWQWHQHHLMSVVLSMSTLYILAQDNQNEVQHDLFGHVRLLALHDNDSMVNETITFLRSRKSNELLHDIFGHVIPLASASHDTNGIINCTWHWYQHPYWHWQNIHIIPLNNHLNKRNVMLLLIAPSEFCDRKHVIAIYMLKTNMPLKCNI